MLPAAAMHYPTTTHPPIQVLLVEDDEDDYLLTKLLVSAPENANIQLTWVNSYEAALQALTTGDYDIYLVDYRLGEHTGIDLIQEASRQGSLIPMILLTGQDDLSIDQSALELGAADYLVKGRIDAQLLGRSIRYALRQAQSMQKMSEQESRYRTLFEQSIDAIFVADTTLHIQDANSSVEQLFGYTYAELRQLNVLRLFLTVDDYRKLRFHVREYHQVKDFEATLLHKSGRKRSCLISVWSVGGQGQNGFQGMIRDVTEQKRAQQELLIAEKLTMTGKIARSIAHEVRNPLTNLSLSLEQLKEELPQDDEYISMYTDIIGRNVERISQLITEMLNSSKPRELDRQPQSLNDVVRDTLHRVSDRLKLRSMQLITDLSDDDCTALLDREQIKTALINILINAVEAMEIGVGRLIVRTRCIEPDQISIQIEDNGSGIPEENRKRLFDPFFTGKASGMGLGLTTTQNIVNSHRGTIEVESEVNRGTVFRIILPRH